MQTAILIQKSIQRQATARKHLPSPLAQFRTFLNRGAKKPSPEEEKQDTPPPPPEGEEKGETLPPPENAGGEGGIDWGGGEPSGEPADAGEASQDAPETTQGASEEGAGETLPPTPETPQGVAGDAPAKSGKAKGAKKRGK